MTPNISDDEVRRLDEKNKRLTDFIKEVAGINVELLRLSLNVEDSTDAKTELDKLTNLVQTIQLELLEDIKSEVNGETNNDLPASQQDNSFKGDNHDNVHQVEREEDDCNDDEDKGSGVELNDQKETLVVKIPAAKPLRKRKNPAKSNKKEFKTKKKKTKPGKTKKEKNCKLDKKADIKQKPVIKERADNGIQENNLDPEIPMLGPCMCERCGKLFKSRATLRGHIKLHSDKDANLSFSCNVCRKQFSLKSSLRSHMKLHSQDKDFQCTYCGRCFNRKAILTMHMRTHSGEQPHICSICNKSFSLIGNLRRHERIHSGEKPWKCTYCDRSFNQSDILKTHIRTHTQEKPFKCPNCNKSFKYYNDLHRHNLRAHSKDVRRNPKLHQCPLCQKKFLHQRDLTSHTRLHTGERPFQCCHCVKGFSTKIQLEDHIRTHTGCKPFKCLVCGKAFSRRYALYLHENIHKGKHFICSECGRSFNNPANMMRHMRNHSGDKPYKCHVCNRGFGQKVSLDSHMWTHMPDKRYKCGICGKGYNDKRNLTTHYKTHSSLVITPPHPSSQPPTKTEQVTPSAVIHSSMTENAYNQTIPQPSQHISQSLTHNAAIALPHSQGISIVVHSNNNQVHTLSSL